MHAYAYAYAKCICTPCDRMGKNNIALKDRIKSHRMAYYRLLLDNTNVDGNNNVELVIDDRNALGAHLWRNHHKQNRNDFDLSWKFYILKISDPINLRVEEQRCINNLKTLMPSGFNHINSYFILF